MKTLTIYYHPNMNDITLIEEWYLPIFIPYDSMKLNIICTRLFSFSE